MCGITGYAGRDLSQLLPTMIRLLEHRGPDDEGIFTGHNIGLAMRRLAIIGLDSGKQPMSNRNGNIILVFNGEIYNYKELTNQLKRKGYQFNTDSDTEVIVHLYDEYGEQFLEHLRGMFAIALWNIKTESLLLARDRIGEKPLFYHCDAGSIVFGSEIKSILPSINEKRVSHRTISEFFAIGYASGGKTFFDGVHKLEPGSLLVWNKGSIRIRKYWQLTDGPIENISFCSARDQLSTTLEEAVRLCLRSDVEVAAFLSGGLDSSLLSALATRIGSKLRTFSVGYSGDAAGFNELHFARKVADYLGTTHEELILTAQSNIELLPKILWHFDEPHGEPTSILVYQLCEFVSNRVKVAIGGTGGDELFFGYPRHKGVKYQSYYNRFPAVLRGLFRYAFFSTSRESTRGGRLAKRVRKFLEGSEKPSHLAYAEWVSLCNTALHGSLVKGAVTHSNREIEVPHFVHENLDENFGYDDLMAAIFNIDVTGYLPEYQLAYMDRMSMANSLEVRSPLCDYKVVEQASSMPSEFKLHRLRSKHILKEVANGLLPEDIINRKKVGFDSPIGQWFKSDLRDFTLSFLASEQIEQTGILHADGVSKIVGQHMSGRRDHSLLLWSILAFEAWHRMYLEGTFSQPEHVRLSDIRGART